MASGALHPESAEVVNALEEMARLLNTGLDRRSIELILGLCEAGVNPDALAAAITEIRDKADAARAAPPSDRTRQR